MRFLDSDVGLLDPDVQALLDMIERAGVPRR
jgi:hypothetical protein